MSFRCDEVCKVTVLVCKGEIHGDMEAKVEVRVVWQKVGYGGGVDVEAVEELSMKKCVLCRKGRARPERR